MPPVINRRAAPVGASIRDAYGYDCEEAKQCEDGSQGSYSMWCCYFLLALVIVGLVFSVMGWHEAKQGSDFAYNAESYAKHHSLRDDARHTCYPLYHEAAGSDPDAAVLILDYLNYELSAADHRQVCLDIANPPPPPTPAPTPAPTPPVMTADDEHSRRPRVRLSDRLCALFEDFPFEEVCGEWHGPSLIQAICSCEPEPEEPIIIIE